jgi:hypothetical protein
MLFELLLLRHGSRQSRSQEDCLLWSISSSGAFDDPKSRAKVSMGVMTVKERPRPTEARDAALKAMGLRKGDQLFQHLSKDDRDYVVPLPCKQSEGGKDKKAACKKRKGGSRKVSRPSELS